MTALFIPPRVPLADPNTGLCNPVWYRFFADMFAAFAAGGGTGGVLQATNGGTGITNYTPGDLIYASTATTLNKLPDVATGNALISGGAGFPPSWGKIGLTSHVSGTLPIGNGGTGSTATQYCNLATNVTGTLPVVNGGTGATTLTGYIKGNGTGPFTASATIPATDVTGAALTKVDDTNVTLTLGGTPATALLRATSITVGWTGTLAVTRGGTGVATSTGSGSNVLNTSPTLVTPILGTPTSGTLTNCTGLPISTGVSGLGANVAAFLTTPSSANLAAAVTDEDGTGVLPLESTGTWTPTVTAGSGTLTAYTASGWYTKIGRQVHATVAITITTNGTAAGSIFATLPFTAATGPSWVGAGRENASTGTELQALVNSGGTTMTILTYNNLYPGGSGYILIASVSYYV